LGALAWCAVIVLAMAPFASATKIDPSATIAVVF
jgi:hypothetical protein